MEAPVLRITSGILKVKAAPFDQIITPSNAGVFRRTFHVYPSHPPACRTPLPRGNLDTSGRGLLADRLLSPIR